MRERDRHFNEPKRNVLIGFSILLFTILLYGVVHLQLIDNEFYQQKSLDNSIRKIIEIPVRGIISDSENNILVENRPAFSLAVIPKIIHNKILEDICVRLEIDLSKAREKINKQYGFRPVIIERDIDYESVIFFEEHRLQYPGLIIVHDYKRHYNKGVNSPHIFGYIGEVTPEEQAKNNSYEAGDMVGKSAIEKAYDQMLRGEKGVSYVKVDAAGRELGALQLGDPLNPVHGNDLTLHMRYSLQQFAESLMVDVRGSLVALDTRNGGVIAIISKPDFDPRLLSGKIDADVWNQLLNDEGHPLYSRAIQSVYPPGSTYKVVAAFAALQENIVSTNWKVTCPGYFVLGRKTIRCWKPDGHGTVNMYDAIKQSCNVYFYKLGLEIGLETWSKYSKIFGFGNLTGIDLPNESYGLVPTVDFFNKRYGVNGWTKGNLANLAIGQGELLVTPLQLAQLAMILANKGVYYEPHLIKYFYDHSIQNRIPVPAIRKKVSGISEENFNIIREAMRQVADGGTGWLGKVAGIEMAGKTGTAQNPHGDSHAWFMAFAPFQEPEIAVAVIVENGGGGGAIAAPISRKFMEMYFFNELIPRPAPKKDDIMRVDSLISPIMIEDFNPIEIPLGEENGQ